MSAGTGLRSVLAAAVAAVALVAVAFTASALQEEPFTHEAHQGLFPVCTGCHTGIPTQDPATVYPDADLCARCHDGTEQEEVAWTPPEDVPDNLTFAHPAHAAALEAEGEDALACETCHTEPGSDRMSVDERVEEEGCFSCHAHEADVHFEDADCATCHLPLAASELTRTDVEGLPVPGTHETSRFLLEGHGDAAEASTATCATCHTRDRCVACHVDSGRAPIGELEPAPAGMDLPPMPAHYPVPDSHGDEGWLSSHGTQAPAGECSTCHATEDCTVCHQAPVPSLVAALPSRDAVPAPGVVVERRAPESHGSLFFEEAHGTLAAAESESCATCHAESFCVSCHDAAAEGGYHPPDFVTRHSAVAWGQDQECATCHNTAVFCRSCHEENGLGSQGRLGPGFHDAEPVWLLRHGQAARQNLEGCVSCHEQRECMQCHSTLGSFQISPHPRDFDAEEAWARNPRTCLACHVRNPVQGGAP